MRGSAFSTYLILPGLPPLRWRDLLAKGAAAHQRRSAPSRFPSEQPRNRQGVLRGGRPSRGAELL